MTYLLLLFAVALTSAALAASATIWSQVQRRERERQLLWAGDQIRRSIVAYSQVGGGNDTIFPLALQDLLLDPRSPARRRFLRQVYPDPMTQGQAWGLIRDPRGQIIGVYSRSTAAPLKTGRFALPYASFEQARSYADWRFTAVPEAELVDRPRARSGAAAASAASSPAAANQGP